MAIEVKDPPVRRLNMKQKFNLYERLQPNGQPKIIKREDGAELWNGSYSAIGAPYFWLGTMVSAARVRWLDHYGHWPISSLIRKCQHTDEEGRVCIAPLCHEDSGEEANIVYPKKNRSIHQALSELFESGCSIQILRADQIGATKDMACYGDRDDCSCETRRMGEMVVTMTEDPDAALEVAGAALRRDLGVVSAPTYVVDTFDPLASENDVVCSRCFNSGGGEERPSITKNTHIINAETGHGIPKLDGPLELDKLEDLYIAALDNGLPPELVVGYSSVADVIVVEELKEELYAKPILLNINYDNEVGQRNGNCIDVPVGHTGHADPEVHKRFVRAMDKQHKAETRRAPQRQATDGDQYRTSREVDEKEDRELRRAAAVALQQPERRFQSLCDLIKQLKAEAEEGTEKYPFPPRAETFGASIWRKAGTWRMGEDGEEIVTYPPDWMPKRLTADEALALSLELSGGRKPKPEPRAVVFTDFTQELLVGAACHWCGEWIDLTEDINHPCFSMNERRKNTQRDRAFWESLEAQS